MMTSKSIAPSYNPMQPSACQAKREPSALHADQTEWVLAAGNELGAGQTLASRARKRRFSYRHAFRSSLVEERLIMVLTLSQRHLLQQRRGFALEL